MLLAGYINCGFDMQKAKAEFLWLCPSLVPQILKPHNREPSAF